MYLKEKIEFPCGLIQIYELRGFLHVKPSYLENLICPIHGKKCKK
jgi:hypothetical protein